MDETLWWLMSIIGPAILVVLLLWLVLRGRGRSEAQGDARAERATDDLYDDEERRRREGTDDL